MDEDEDTRMDEGERKDKDRERKRGGEAAGDAGGGEDNPYGVFILMDSFYDKLKLLDYDTDFCTKRGFKPIPRHYFAVTDNANEQLFYFGNLMSWMLSLSGQRFPPPEQYDDPNQVATNIMLELRKQGLPTEFSQTKLKQGSGEEICQVLNNLAQMALKARKWKWSKPDHTQEDTADDTQHDEDVEVVAERVVEDDVAEDILEDDEEAAVIDSGPAAAAPEPALDKETTEQEQQAWLAEVERVLPQLKVLLRTDVKDWRGHVDEMKTSLDEISGSLNSTKDQLDKLQAEIARTLEKIGSREKYVNSQLEGLIGEYRTQQDALAAVSNRWNQSSTGVNGLARELAQITEELESIKGQMDERGSSMTDSGPLVKIKQGLTKLKMETAQMDVRIGVIEHILLSASIREKSDIVHDMHAVPAGDDE